MQWFKHDTDATIDGKLKKVILRYGPDGYAIYFHCLELIAGNISDSNITFELEHDSEVISDNLKVKSHKPDQTDIERVEEIMRFLVSEKLFEYSSGKITCFKMLKRLDSSMTSNQKMRSIITEAKKNHDIVMISHDSIMQEENRIDKIREEENIRGTAKRMPPPQATTIARLIYTLHKEKDQKYKVDDRHIASWAADIEKIARLDGRDYDEIERVLRWAKADGFWCPNIMSGKKFREKFPTLYAQMTTKRGASKPLPVHERTTWLEMED